MWNMMCDVMPTISEDSITQRGSQFSGEDANFEQLMVSMLDERDKLMESLRETQERLGEAETKLVEVEKERDSLQRQISANLPQVRATYSTHSFNFEIFAFAVSSIDSSWLDHECQTAIFEFSLSFPTIFGFFMVNKRF